MKKWLKQSLLLCLLAALLSSSVFAADTESGLCDLNSHNGYQLIADGHAGRRGRKEGLSGNADAFFDL